MAATAVAAVVAAVVAPGCWRHWAAAAASGSGGGGRTAEDLKFQLDDVRP